MRFGSNFIFDVDFAALRDMAVETEDHGFSTIWVVDAPLTPSAYPSDWMVVSEPLVQMGAILAVTRSVAVGQSILLVTYREPIVTAKALAYAHRASAGRVILGAGMGWREEEFGYFHVEKSSRGRRMDAVLDAIEAFFSGRADFANEFYGWTGAAPLPVVGHTLPIWIGGNSRAAMERALRRRAGWQPIPAAMEGFADFAAEYRERGGHALGAKLRVAATPAEVDRGVGGFDEVSAAILELHRLGVTDLSLVFGRSAETHRKHQAWFAENLLRDLAAATREFSPNRGKGTEGGDDPLIHQAVG